MSATFTCEDVARAVLGEPTKRTGSELLWHCPNHNDEHESLAINPKKNVFLCAPCNTGGTAWQLTAFLAGLDPGDKPSVMEWLRERGLMPKRKRANKVERGPCVATYIYTEVDGKPIARKLRFEPGSNGRAKEFAWERFENGGWKSGLAGLELPLYRISEIAHEPFVVLTEGEKDSDAGAALGLPTTTSGGTGSFRPEHAEALRGKDVVVIADADEPGRLHAQKVAGLLYGKAASVKLVEIPGSKDLAAAVEAGWNDERLFNLFDSAPEWRPGDGAKILDSVLNFIRRFVSLSLSQARAVALWVAHTHAFEAADCTPYLAINSPEKQSGKTRLLEILRLFVREPWLTGRVTAAVLVRKVDAVQPTLLLDESDAAFGGEPEYAQTLRSVLDTGYRRGGSSSLCVGQGSAIEYKDFSTFCPKAIAGLGELPDTVADRSVPIRLKRARRGSVERFRQRDAEAEGAPIRERLAAWCAASLETLREARPAIPEALSDRQADCCEPLLAVADSAGGNWPETARAALVELCAEGQREDSSVGVRLLGDIRSVMFPADGDGSPLPPIERIASVDLAKELGAMEDRPWSEWGKAQKPITPPQVARLLGRYGITPTTLRLPDGRRLKGYELYNFTEAWTLYLPPDRPSPPFPDRDNVTSQYPCGEEPLFRTVTPTLVTDTKKREIANIGAPCHVVTDQKPGDEGARKQKRTPKNQELFPEEDLTGARGGGCCNLGEQAVEKLEF